MPKVLVTPHLLLHKPGPYKDILEGAGLEIVYPPEGANTLQEQVIAGLLTPDIKAMLASTEPLNRKVLGNSALRVVARMGVGYDSIDIAAATEKGVAITITPGTLEDSVAEQTLALLLAVTRGVIERDREVRSGQWSRAPMPRLAGKTFGIVGLGRIGRAVVPRIKGLQMKVIAYEPFPNKEFVAANDIELCELDEIFRRSDVVSLHSISSPDTYEMVDERRLRLMKPDAVFINTGRGSLVREEDLIKVMKEGHLFGAGLDVFKQEPLPLDSPILQLPNVVTATHVGGIDLESQVATSRLAAQCIADLYEGKWPADCVVNRDLQGKWKW